MNRYTVLVTGGNGFLGQHIVRLLQEKADFVTHINVLDIRKYSKHLDFEERKPVTAFVGDITDESVLESATSGVDCVVHVASIVDVRIFPDEANMHKVNVTGTEQLIDVCIRQNVRSFVYCSSQTVIFGYKDIIDSNETHEIPKEFLFKGYGGTKHMAEQIVELHNGTCLPDGGTMRTLTLRPVTMYGELDVHWVGHTLLWAKNLGGVMCQFANGTTQAAYVGNVAWGFVCAVKTMREKPEFGGEVFFMCDDTPLANMFELVEPFLKCRGYKLTPFVLPYWLIYLAAVLLTVIAWLIYPIYEINPSFTTSSMRFINMRINSVYVKAKKMLHYTPLYSHEESIRRSIAHYKTC